MSKVMVFIENGIVQWCLSSNEGLEIVIVEKDDYSGCDDEKSIFNYLDGEKDKCFITHYRSEVNEKIFGINNL